MGTVYCSMWFDSIRNVSNFYSRNMKSQLKSSFVLFILGLALTNAMSIDDGGLDSLTKMRTFSSAMSNINGEKHEESYFRNGAQVNGNPIYLVRGEKQDDDDDVHEAFDVILPQENVHSHLDRQNGQESAYEEPLDESEDYDYPQLNQLVDDDALFVPEESEGIEYDGDDLDEDTIDPLNARAEEEALEDYYDQLLKNLV